MDATNVILAECPRLGRVRLCDCKAVHLNIGPVTINLDPEAFVKTAILLQNAVEQLSQIRSASEMTPKELQMSGTLNTRFTQ